MDTDNTDNTHGHHCCNGIRRLAPVSAPTRSSPRALARDAHVACAHAARRATPRSSLLLLLLELVNFLLVELDLRLRLEERQIRLALLLPGLVEQPPLFRELRGNLLVGRQSEVHTCTHVQTIA